MVFTKHTIGAGGPELLELRLDISPLLLVVDALLFRQVVLLQQRRDLVCAPQPVVDLAVLGLANRRELN